MQKFVLDMQEVLLLHLGLGQAQLVFLVVETIKGQSVLVDVVF